MKRGRYMAAREELIARFQEKWSVYLEHHEAFYANPSTERIDPFKITDGLYYVGDRKVCIHLIDTGDGLILIDSGYFGAEHLLVDSIWRAGFDPKNIRWIIHTHGHYDHFGASEEFKRMYGAKLAISRVDMEYMAEKPHRALINNKRFPYAKIPEFDLLIEDGDVFELGNVKIRFVLCPGHTPGVMSMFFDTSYEGKTYRAGLFGGIGTGALTLPYACYDEYEEDRTKQMLDSIERVRGERVDVHLGNHPENNRTLQKREKQLKEGGNPFIDPESWGKMLDGLEKTAKQIAVDNKTLY